MDALFSDYDDIRKSGWFDPQYYLATYPDVADRNVDPLVHFLEEGARQGRNPRRNFDSAFYLEQCRLRGERPDNPLLHYLRVGAARGFQTKRDAADSEVPPAAPSNAAPTPVLVAIESQGLVEGPGGKSRVAVGGWALGPARIAEITVTLDGEVRGTATYGLARPDIARLYPERAEAGRSGFVLAFDLPSGKSGAIEAILTVRTADGGIGRHPLHIDVPPQEINFGGGDPFGGPSADIDGLYGRDFPLQLFIDSADVDRNGILLVEGWVVCPVQIDAVDVLIGEMRIGRAEYGRARLDVEADFPGYPNARHAGFRLISDARPYGQGARKITVRAIACTGMAAEAETTVVIPQSALGSEVPRLDPGFQYHCDEIVGTATGRIVVTGWIVGPSPVEAVRVRLDDEEIGQAEIGFDRPEIGNLFPTLPHARNPGFAFAVETGKLLRGRHALTLFVATGDGASNEISLEITAGLPQRYRDADPDPDLKLSIDAPAIIDGVAETPVRGNLQINGWGLARAGVAQVEIAIDGTPMALADYGIRRLDIRAAFPDWPDSLASGFNALIPHRVLPQGSRTVTVTLRDKAGETAGIEFAIVVEEPAESAGPWSLRRTMAVAEIDLDRNILQRCGRNPVFTAALPVKDADSASRAAVTLASLAAQVYPNWRLLIVTAGRPIAALDRLLTEMRWTDDRVAVISELSLDLIETKGRPDADVFLTVLSPGDELGVDAFLEMAIAAAAHPQADFLYSDERRRNPASGEIEAYFKPQWSPDLMLSSNYIGRLWCARADLLATAGEPRALLDFSEYDLLLRCTESAKDIRHIPAVLCESTDNDPDAAAPAEQALERALARRGVAAEILAGRIPRSHRLKRKLTEPGLVSIIIPTCAAQGMIETCITSLRRLTAYRDYEIICIENIPTKDRSWRDWLGRNADRVLPVREAFNWSRFNNLAAAEARGKYLLFLNDDIEITDPDWLDVLLGEAQRPEVGVVGPQLLYSDGRVQHAGMFLAAMGQARHAFRYAEEDAPGYFGLALTQRNVIAVTGACLMTRRATFDALGGFDEAQAIVNNDLDYCLRAWRSGLLNVYTPHARLVHHEAVSRAALDDVYDVASFDAKWRGLFLAGDPYFNPNLSKSQDDFGVEHEPTRVLVTGRPAFRRDEVRRILVVKLDHIGDCVIAFPAVRRLKQHFPAAHITVLTSRTSRPIWLLEASVDETIEFDFFHPRSADGEIKLTDTDWKALRDRLSGERIDLAVDLRKHTETRPVLQHTGARWLAGFDFRNQFAWLDFALEWTGDQIYARKRQHNGDDLVNLVDAIAAASEADRSMIAAHRTIRPTALPLSDKASSGPLVCVHPGAGNDMKQWPPGYFAAVIDRLVETDGAHVVLVGAAGEEEVAAEILSRLQSGEAVTSLVGKVSLAELPGVLAGASLFLGNDSGPKHLAAGLGVPTVGIHAGTVDVREWGPVGANAIAVAREVVCSPCYLSSPEDCRRNLVCIRELAPSAVYDACKRLLLLAASTRETVAAGAAQSEVAAPPARPARSRPQRQASGPAGEPRVAAVAAGLKA
jgi:ADP-heptose:LPS heptosyltransferase/GT2 family glycosyltransferase